MSQLAIGNFNDVSGKHMNTPCFFIFVWFSLKAKAFLAHICRKKTLPVCKKHAFFLCNSLMLRKLTNDSSLASEHNFEASEF